METFSFEFLGDGLGLAPGGVACFMDEYGLKCFLWLSVRLDEMVPALDLSSLSRAAAAGLGDPAL